MPLARLVSCSALDGTSASGLNRMCGRTDSSDHFEYQNAPAAAVPPYTAYLASLGKLIVVLSDVLYRLARFQILFSLHEIHDFDCTVEV